MDRRPTRKVGEIGDHQGRVVGEGRGRDGSSEAHEAAAALREGWGRVEDRRGEGPRATALGLGHA